MKDKMDDRILEVLEKVCGDDDVKTDRDINLFESGLLDSLGLIELLIELDKKLNIKIEPTEIDRSDIETPGKLIEFISKRG